MSQWRYTAGIRLNESRWRAVATAVAAGGAAGIIEYIVHTAVMEASLSPQVLAILDSIIVALITAIFLYLVLAEARARRKALLQHLRNVAELNHQIRNALQTIVHSRYLAPSEQAEAVLVSVDRIDRTLRELFPAIAQRRGREQDGERCIHAVESRMPFGSTQQQGDDTPERRRSSD